MSAWTPELLDEIGRAEELQIAPRRHDGSLRPYTTIWAVRVGDDLYVRSYRGRAGSWFRDAADQHEGRIRVVGVERDVAFEEPGPDVREEVDEAYRGKYVRYADTYLPPMLSQQAAAATLRLLALS